MSKITYTDKVALNINSDIPDINKCNATDMNEIKEVVNENETKILLAVSSSAPATCETGDMYYNTTNDLIYTATGTNTWGSTGEEPTENTIYIVFDSQSAYAYDGNELISVGGGSGDLIMVDSDTPTASTKLYIESTDLDFQGLEISNTYTTGNNVAYSADYVNGIVESGSNANGNYIKYTDGSMICYREVSKTLAITNSWGSWYYGEDGTQYDFAQEFISPPTVIVELFPSTNDATCIKGNWASPTITASSITRAYAGMRPTSANSVSVKATILAIGKWK